VVSCSPVQGAHSRDVTIVPEPPPENGTPLATYLSATGRRADNPGTSPVAHRRIIMADTIREKIENAGDAAKDAAKKVGDRVQEGADKTAEKAADATQAAGQKMKDAGEKIKDKSGA
jgi:hypothetical protein